MNPSTGRTNPGVDTSAPATTRTFGSIRVGRHDGYRSAIWPTETEPEVILSYGRHAVEASATSDPDAVLTVVFDGEPHHEHTLVVKAAAVGDLDDSRDRECRYVQADLERSYFAWVRHDEFDGERRAEVVYVLADGEAEGYVRLLLMATLPDQSECITEAMAFLRRGAPDIS